MTPQEPAQAFAALTDIGLQREENQDNYGYFAGSAEQPEKGQLLLVADGMGGEAGGGLASHLAIETILEHYQGVENHTNPAEALRESFQRASKRIQEQVREDPSLAGMGTTCTALAVIGKKAYVVHVGDTRAYLIRGGEIQRLTRDQTWVQEMIGRGLISEEEARQHPQRNVLTQALGSQTLPEPAVSAEPLVLEPGDLLLLCSDGLSGLVTDGEILKLAGEAPDLREACAGLVDLAKSRGGHDNITVLLYRIPE